MWTQRSAGFGIAEVLIAASLSTIVLLGLTTMLGSINSSSRKLDSSADITTIKLRVSEAADCSATFPGAAQPPCAAGQFVEIKSTNGNVVVPKTGLKVGNWLVQARCESVGVSVRAAKVVSGAKLPPTWDASTKLSSNQKQQIFFRDEVGGVNNATGRKLFYDWSHPKGTILPGGAAGWCSHLWGVNANQTCSGPGQYVVSVDLNRRIVTCGDIPECSNLEILRREGNRFVCVRNVSDAIGSLDAKINRIDQSIEPRINNTMITNLAANRYRVYSAQGRAGDGEERARVFCPDEMVRVSCSGARSPNLNDTCPEEKCSFIGVRPIGDRGCEVSIDGDRGTRPAVFVTCWQPPNP